MNSHGAKSLIWVSGKRIKQLLQDMRRLLEDSPVTDVQRSYVASAINALKEADVNLDRAYAAGDVEKKKYNCGNCEFGTNNDSRLRPIKDIFQRVAPGEPMPAGECPNCGALVHLNKD